MAIDLHIDIFHTSFEIISNKYHFKIPAPSKSIFAIQHQTILILPLIHVYPSWLAPAYCQAQSQRQHNLAEWSYSEYVELSLTVRQFCISSVSLSN